jgi:selenocysteine lyase/cysteine desulfurase
MMLSRRAFLAEAVLAASAATTSCISRPTESDDLPPPYTSGDGRWADLRQQFDLSDDDIHLSALLIASHPRDVRDAIDRYRRELDRNPATYLPQHNTRLQSEARKAAAEYLEAEADEIALTDSTTMGLGLLYAGLHVAAGQELLTTSNDYYATHEALRAASKRTGATVREIPLYEDGDGVSEAQLIDRVIQAVGAHTRAVALTWVHSSTGVKLPLPAISEGLERINRGRDDEDRVLLCVDGVHGFGVEDAGVKDLGADFFAAGCHKWLFGPRGTGILWGRRRSWRRVHPTVPSFTDDEVWQSWLQNREPESPSSAARVSPGGFKPFEHQWAIPEAFALHKRLGKAQIARRTHDLARQLKEGLGRMGHVRLITPMEDELSAGIVCFDIDGMRPHAVVRALRERRIVATVTPYATTHARLTPSIINTEAEIDTALRAVRELT